MNTRGEKLTGITPKIEGETVKFINDEAFIKGKTYYLVVKKGVKDIQGRALKEDVMLKFKY